MNSGMYKNAFTCGIPNSNEVGNVFAAALGYVAGNAEKGLESLADVKPEDNVTAQKLIDEDHRRVKWYYKSYLYPGNSGDGKR